MSNNNLNKTEENVMGDSVPPLPIDVNNAQIEYLIILANI